MRDLFPALKKISLVAALGIAFGVLAFGQPAQAASLFEKNFWLSGPRYDGNLPPCESGLAKVSSQFAENCDQCRRPKIADRVLGRGNHVHGRST